ncbi:MAG: hypothetical protein WCX06_00515 [Candidatus Paceibacterota bacterium]|jgi:hypothetical protein
MQLEHLPLDFCPVVKGKKQVTTREVVDFLKGKTVVLDCGHKYSLNKGGYGKTMIIYADGGSNCHD